MECPILSTARPTLQGMPTELFRHVISFAVPEHATVLNCNNRLALADMSCTNLLRTSRAFYHETSEQIYRKRDLLIYFDGYRPGNSRHFNPQHPSKYTRKNNFPFHRFSRIRILGYYPRESENTYFFEQLDRLSVQLAVCHLGLRSGEARLRVSLFGTPQAQPPRHLPYAFGQPWTLFDTFRINSIFSWLPLTTGRSIWSFVEVDQIACIVPTDVSMSTIGRHVNTLLTWFTGGTEQMPFDEVCRVAMRYHCSPNNGTPSVWRNNMINNTSKHIVITDPQYLQPNDMHVDSDSYRRKAQITEVCPFSSLQHLLLKSQFEEYFLCLTTSTIPSYRLAQLADGLFQKLKLIQDDVEAYIFPVGMYEIKKRMAEWWEEMTKFGEDVEKEVKETHERYPYQMPSTAVELGLEWELAVQHIGDLEIH